MEAPVAIPPAPRSIPIRIFFPNSTWRDHTNGMGKMRMARSVVALVTVDRCKHKLHHDRSP